MLEVFEESVRPHFNFWIYVILMMMGLWALIAKKNYIKKLIGLSIFQTAIILFYVSIGVKEGATIPILHHHGPEHHETAASEASPHPRPAGDEAHTEAKDHGHDQDPDKMTNPLPHVLMLTAIVVGVSTLGVALSITQLIFKEFGTIEEDEILDQLKSGETNG